MVIIKFTARLPPRLVKVLRTSGSIISSKPRFPHFHHKKVIVYTSLRLENTAGTGFDPIWAGTNATNVPKEAIVVNNADSNVRFSDNPTWNASSNARFYSPSTRHTRKNGASVTYTFEGVAIW